MIYGIAGDSSNDNGAEKKEVCSYEKSSGSNETPQALTEVMQRTKEALEAHPIVSSVSIGCKNAQYYYLSITSRVHPDTFIHGIGLRHVPTKFCGPLHEQRVGLIVALELILNSWEKIGTVSHSDFSKALLACYLQDLLDNPPKTGLLANEAARKHIVEYYANDIKSLAWQACQVIDALEVLRMLKFEQRVYNGKIQSTIVDMELRTPVLQRLQDYFRLVPPTAPVYMPKTKNPDVPRCMYIVQLNNPYAIAHLVKMALLVESVDMPRKTIDIVHTPIIIAGPADLSTLNPTDLANGMMGG